MSILVDFGRALAQLGDPRFRRVLWRALLVVLAALVAVFWALVWTLGLVLPETVALPWIGEVGFVDDVASLAAIGALIAGSVVLMVPATAAAAGFFLDDVADAVEARHYPGLPAAREPGLARQALDSARFLGLVLAVNLLAMVVYLTVAPIAPIIFWIANGFLLGREYFQLVAQRRLTPEAALALRRSNAGRIWLAGIAMALPLSLPLVNLLVPILGVAVFTHQFHRMARDSAIADRRGSVL